MRFEGIGSTWNSHQTISDHNLIPIAAPDGRAERFDANDSLNPVLVLVMFRWVVSSLALSCWTQTNAKAETQLSATATHGQSEDNTLNDASSRGKTTNMNK